MQNSVETKYFCNFLQNISEIGNAIADFLKQLKFLFYYYFFNKWMTFLFSLMFLIDNSIADF